METVARRSGASEVDCEGTGEEAEGKPGECRATESRAGRFQEGGSHLEGLEVELVRVVRQGMRWGAGV